MKFFVINLNSEQERWRHIEQVLSESSFYRVEAIHGTDLKLPIQEFNKKKFLRKHGRFVNVFEIACYLSHIKAIRSFLETKERYAIICEDDIVINRNFYQIISHVLELKQYWNIIRLTGLKYPKGIDIIELGYGYTLKTPLERLKGCGAYLLDRRAAEILVKQLLPIWLPYDHAMDREWNFNLRMFTVTPFPISQTNHHFDSQIQHNAQKKCSRTTRWFGTYPYQCYNEISRLIFRSIHGIKIKIKLY